MQGSPKVKLNPDFLQSVPTSIFPSSDNAFDIGSDTLRWRNIRAVNIYGDTFYERGTPLSNKYAPLTHTHSRSEITDFWSTPFWENIPDKPSTFPPESHTHSRSDITDFWSSPFWDNIPDKPSTFPPSTHGSSHNIGGSDEIPDLATLRSDFDNHKASKTDHVPSGKYICSTSRSDQLPSWDDIPDKPSEFPPEAHSHVRSDITDFWASPFWNNIPDKPSTFPPSAHASSHKPSGSDALFPADFHINPASDNAYDLGNETFRWAVAHVMKHYIYESLFVKRDAVIGKLWSVPEMILAEDDEGLTAYVSTVGGTAYVVAFFDNTVVYVNGKFQGVLNAGERMSLSLNAGDVITANKPIMVHSSSERHVPITWKDTKFVIPFYRNDPQTIYIYAPDGDATVDIYVGTDTSPTTTVTVSKGTATKVQLDVSPPKTVILESTAPIIVAVSSNNETYDFRFIHPPAKDLIEIPSTSFYISALEDNTKITWFQGNNSGTYTLNRGEIVVHATLGISTGSQYNATPVRVIADKPIMIGAFADGDGFDATCGLPINKLGTYYVLPVNAQWLSIAVPFDNTRIRIFYQGQLKYETTISNTFSNNTPALLYLNPSDIDASWSSIPYGTTIVSDKPIMIIFDCAEVWTDDETVLLGINHRKWRIWHNPTLTLTTDIVPPSDNAFDLGNNSYRWRSVHAINGYFSNIVQVGDLVFKNSWRISEHRKYGLVLISPDGKMYKIRLEEVNNDEENKV